ncbi:hypothetical protein FRC03_001584 [Tulasnella sp. 419]|nr:hypothetical protein FRC03_001584 [Tulasnella sp. 419]
MLQKYFGALYPAKEAVEQILKPRDGYTPIILDVGAGSGGWAIDMSLQFPHCEVIGLDLVPPKIREVAVPDNCWFEIDDGNLSFTHWTNKFDLIHVRCINEGIQDFPTFFNNLAQTMKPGALFIIGCGTFQFYDKNEQPYQDVKEGEEGFSWVQKWFREVSRHYINIHSTSPGLNPESISAEMWWETWAANNPNFVNINMLNMKTRIGNWSSEPSEEIACADELCKLDIFMLIQSYIPLMSSSGYPPETIEHWSKVRIPGPT